MFFVVQLGQLQVRSKSIEIIEKGAVEAAGLAPLARFVGTGSKRRWTTLSSATPSTFVFYATFFVSLGIITDVTFGRVVSYYQYWPVTLTFAALLYLVLIRGIAVSVKKLLVAITHPDLNDPDDQSGSRRSGLGRRAAHPSGFGRAEDDVMPGVDSWLAGVVRAGRVLAGGGDSGREHRCRL